MFRPEHRVHLPEPGMLNLQEDDSSALVSNLNTQGDESTKCLALCEPKCDKLNVPYYLQVMSVLLKWFLSLKNRLKARVNSFQVSAYISLSHELPSRLTKNILAPKIQKNRKFTTTWNWMHLKSVFNIKPSLTLISVFFTEKRKLLPIWASAYKLRVGVYSCFLLQAQMQVAVFVPLRLLPSL